MLYAIIMALLVAAPDQQRGRPPAGAAPFKNTLTVEQMTNKQAVVNTSAGTFVIDQKAYPTERQFRRAAIRRCPSRVTTDSFAWQFRGAILWRLGDHVVGCYSRTSN